MKEIKIVLIFCATHYFLIWYDDAFLCVKEKKRKKEVISLTERTFISHEGGGNTTFLSPPGQAAQTQHLHA